MSGKDLAGPDEVDLSNLPAPEGEASELRKIERPSPLTGLANAWLAVVAVLFIMGREVIENEVETGEILGTFGLFVVIGIGIIAVLALIIGVIQWRTTTFIVDHEFRIERRFISSSTTRIDFTKVQSVDILRPLVARLLGLAQVRIEVGAESNQNLRFLTKSRAESLRDHLLARMAPTTADGSTGFSDEGSQPGAAPASVADDAPVKYRASTSTMVLGSLLQLGPVAIVVIVGMIVALVLIPGGSAFLWIPLLATLWQVPSGVIKNWRFTIRQVPQGLRVQRGLFSTVQMTLRPDRVQAVGLSQGVWHRLVGIYTVRLTVLGNSLLEDDDGSNIDVLVPFGKWDEARDVVRFVWPDVDIDDLRWVPQARQARWLTWFARHDAQVTDQLLCSRSKMLGAHINLIPHARVQGLATHQGPLQRRLGLGDVAAQSIAGPVQVRARHLLVEDARSLFSLALERSSSARKDPDAEAHVSSEPWHTSPDAER